MTEEANSVQSKLSRNILTVAGVTAGLLLVAFLLKKTTGSPEWTATDFTVVAIMLFGTDLAYVLITHRRKEKIYPLAVALAAVTGLFFFWSNLAVGIIGSEVESANLMYFGVLIVAFLGSIISRFKPQGLKATMWVTAGAQVLTVIIALMAGWQRLAESSVMEIIGLNGFFTALWVTSALLFGQVKRENKPKIP
ncbi:MAG: hypothetical protein N3G18_07625 [Candidatus Saccharicenans sp.]|nr:hypothetical protein [Candidatus Saccharicenans sp.]